ncbi:MAG: peptide ABC transporter permease [Thalassolituus sp.]|jgi:peptide/nickel transport system permease protein|nr:ABC transporter permease [Pseudomonadota bacterium]MEC8104425.1 ABC transporter permease [Pseudomonadota bacterium]MEC8522700.1 ABC transporter permease [Pseudomonadota bacterium]TNC87568.1 MAG: peptide ABC transporter permease [Thalassolituus sp.]|tara:strand:- start:1994 stop:3379 length:1386 start_codon:yes stop_codon:yes gene_type:complete
MEVFDVRVHLLWSDILIFILVASLLCFVVSVLKNPLARGRWAKVFESRIGAASFMVILFYVLIALTDSLHFQKRLEATAESTDVHYAPEMTSVLDLILAPMLDRDEKTYSAPFAIYSFAKENIESDDGTVVREFPRLEHGGSHITMEEQHVADIVVKSLTAIGWTLVPILIVLFIHHWYIRKEDSRLPWPVIYFTFAAIVVVSSWALQMSQYYHVLGTDKVGQDVLYGAIKAIRTGVLIGTLATLVTLPLAVLLGISAGYFRGWVDDVVQYIYTTLNSIPGILLIAASVLLINVYIETNPEQFKLLSDRADFRFIALCFILGMTSWTGLCRLLRAETLKVSQLEYVQAAHAFGVSRWRVIMRHILPNTTHIILIALVLDFSAFVLAEAVLSYIGVGVDSSMKSWGNMINEARSELAREPVVWWSVIAAFILMFTLVLAANLFSDRVRDVFDPRMSGSGDNS